MAATPLVDTLSVTGSKPYDRSYKRGAAWEQGPRSELITLVESRRISPERLAPGRAIDLGCGAGSDAIFLARRGFDVTGVDFSAVGIGRARIASRVVPPEKVPRFVVGDLLDLPSSGVEGPFDLLIDGGTLDDLAVRSRPQVAAVYTALARPGAVLILWCSSGSIEKAARFSLLRAPLRRHRPVTPGEAESLFGAEWAIERLPSEAAPGSACFVMTKR